MRDDDDMSAEERVNALKALLQSPGWRLFTDMLALTAKAAEAQLTRDKQATWAWDMACAQTCRQLMTWPEGQLEVWKFQADAEREGRR